MENTHLAKPSAGEYHEYYGGYINKVNGNVLTYLERQGDSFVSMMKSLAPARWDFRYAEGKWSIKELIAHIIDGERIFVFRALAVARGETGPLPGFDENAYVENGRFDHRKPDSFITEFIHLRQSTLDFFRSLDPLDWERSCEINGHTMSVRAIAYIIAGHLTHHEAIITDRYLKD